MPEIDEDWWEKEKKKFKWHKSAPIPTSGGQQSQAAYSQRGVVSAEYRKYMSVKKEKPSLYVRLVKFFGRYYQIEPDDDTKERIGEAVSLLNWDITPSECTFFMIASTLFWGFWIIPLIFLPIPTFFKLIYLIIPIFNAFYTIKYPEIAAHRKIIESSDELVLAILYLVVYMRSSPNLEGALRFTAMNLKGPLAKDLTQVLWDVNIGKYSSIMGGIEEYMNKWRPYNREFIESLELIVASTYEGDDQRRQLLYNESIKTILTGTRERMKHFSQDLKLPVTVLNGIGILLPIMGMILLPITAIFMSENIKAYHLITFYNVMLPAFLYWFINQTMSKRPPTVGSLPSEGKYLPPGGKISIKIRGKYHGVPAWIFSIIIFVAFAYWGISYFATLPFSEEAANRVPGDSLVSVMSKSPGPMEMLRGLGIVMGIGFSLGFYYWFGFRQRLKKENEIREIESEFSVALFQIGNKMAGGEPIELTLTRVTENIRHLKIARFFKIIVRNIQRMGMTLKGAIFDSDRGALSLYPSNMIEAIMSVVIVAVQKGVGPASMAMKTISTYLKNVHWTKEDINDLLEDTKSTMVFMGYILTPIISGVAVSMASIMESALWFLSEKIKVLPMGSGGTGSMDFLLESLLHIQDAIPPELLQLIVGIYVLQISMIVAIFYVKIAEGNNPTMIKVMKGKVLILSIIIYAVTLMFLSSIFSGMLEPFTEMLGGAVNGAG